MQENLTENMRMALKEYIKQDPVRIFELAHSGGFEPQRVEFIINNESAPFSELLSLHNVLSRTLEEKKKETERKRQI